MKLAVESFVYLLSIIHLRSDYQENQDVCWMERKQLRSKSEWILEDSTLEIVDIK